MIVFLLLVIIAILLFGSSAVLGALGAVLGAVVLLIAIVISLEVLSQVPAPVWWVIGSSICVIVFWIVIYNRKQQNRLDELKASADEAVRRYEVLKNTPPPQYLGKDSGVRFYNDGLNAKKRKRLARMRQSEHVSEYDEGL